jgi:hypothetical protein
MNVRVQCSVNLFCKCDLLFLILSTYFPAWHVEFHHQTAHKLLTVWKYLLWISATRHDYFCISVGFLCDFHGSQSIYIETAGFGHFRPNPSQITLLTSHKLFVWSWYDVAKWNKMLYHFCIEQWHFIALMTYRSSSQVQRGPPVGSFHKGEGKIDLCFHWAPRHEGVLGEWRYSSTHSWPRH